MNPSSSDVHAGSTPASSGKGFLIVGLGASAGGIQALRKFFEQVPADSGMAYVVILHLSPDFESHLAEVLQTTSLLPVTQVHEQVRVVPNHVYVISPNQHLMMADGHLAVLPNLSIEERRAPVDIFFRTLAESHGRSAVCVILSGTGANGSMGLKRVKEREGVVFVQNLEEAEFNEMPSHAVATGLVDAVLPVADIPARIIAYKNSLVNIAIPVEADPQPEALQTALLELLTRLRVQTGHDFTNYKRPTLLRRIERRMGVHTLPDLSAYVVFTRDHPNEIQALLKDLLISVTNFFRDQSAFEWMAQEVLLPIFEGKTSADEIRIWVAACATGEEAYSMAMLCAEYMLGQVDMPAVQIFATDIDDTALAHARAGYYTLNDAADISPERLRRFFTKEGDGFRVQREIREMILFAPHNVIKDPPFSHLDLATCRNLLIYLNKTAQERVLRTLHFALNPGGHLFLGGAESTDGVSDMYALINREHHIYQSRLTGVRFHPIVDASPTFRPEQDATPLQPQNGKTSAPEPVTYGDLHQQLLEQYAPSSIVINQAYEIVHLSERAGRYLQMPGGELSKSLLTLIRPELHLALSMALQQAVQRRTNVVSEAIPIRLEGQIETIRVQVRPVLRPSDNARGFILVLLEPAERQWSDTETVIRSDENLVQQLQAEVVNLTSEQRLSAEQHEVQTEELKAANEELQALNEELRSAAEELETSREELQSTNEELWTVNQELKITVEEITLGKNNLQNLINSADIGTLFLDRSLRVNLFTPAVREIFNLISSDKGRLLSDITSQLTGINLTADAETVLNTLMPIRREVAANDGRVFLMRVLPYRTLEDRINGVIITFVDISEIKNAETALRTSEESLRLLIGSAKDYAIFRMNPHGVISLWSAGAERLFGWTADEVVGQSAALIFTREDRLAGAFEQELKTALDAGSAPDERFHMRKDGTQFYVSGVISSVYRDGVLSGFVKIARDLTERQQIEISLRESHDLLEQRVAERTVELNATNDSRRELLRKMVMTQEEERTRIARDLHDRTAQLLTTLIYGMTTANQQSKPKLMHGALDELIPVARGLMEELHTVVYELRSPVLDLFGLPEALQDYAQNWSGWSGIAANLECIGLEDAADGSSEGEQLPKRLPKEIENALYRIVQEALTNVMRHSAGATQVDVALVKTEHEVTVMVEDNGSGFDQVALAQLPIEKRRLGLLGMQERATLLGGTLTVESQVGRGTTISVQIPMLWSDVKS